MSLFYRTKKVFIPEFSSLFSGTLPMFPTPGGIIGCAKPQEEDRIPAKINHADGSARARLIPLQRLTEFCG